jgi:hypothetical protein
VKKRRRKMSDEIKITELEVQKLNLQPGDVLMVTIRHDDVREDDLGGLRNMLRRFFPNNQAMLFAMGSEGYVKFTVASQPETSYTGYCTDCDCGKKERVEAAKQDNNGREINDDKK